MILDVVNQENQKVASIDVSDEVFGGPPNGAVIWEAVVHEQAARRRGTHATKNRALVSGSGKKPWRQKGTGRARVGEIRNPLWRKGGTVFGPQPRSYDYQLPRKVRRAGLREALAQRLAERAVVVVDRLAIGEARTKAMGELLSRFDLAGKVLVIDRSPADALVRATRNLAGVRLVSSGEVGARDVMEARSLLVTQPALEHLQGALGQGSGARSAPAGA